MIDRVRKLILDKLLERNLTMKEVSLRMGLSHSYLQQFLKRGIPKELGEHDRHKLAMILDVSESLLRGTSDVLPTKEYSRISSGVTQMPQDSQKDYGVLNNLVDTPRGIQQIFGDRDLPVFGTAQGGSEGALIVTSEAVDWVLRPAPLLRVKQGYGMIVAGDSMSPKVDSGCTVLVNPHLPPRSGRLCVFRRHDPDGTNYALLKELRRFTDDTWYVRQLNPDRNFVLKRSEWQDCHVVVGVYFD